MMHEFWRRCVHRPLPLVLCAAALYALPLFFYLTPTLNSDDLIFYKRALIEFSSQFWRGEIYPRWLYDANDGLGSPVFLFLGPGAYYPSVLLEWLSGLDKDGSLRFMLSLMAARMLSGWLCYRWLRKHYEEKAALVITLLFLTIPYAIHEIYVRSELGGQWAFACMFAMLLGVHQLAEQPRSLHALIKTAFASTALILVHLPSFITLGWVPFCYALCASRKADVKRISIALFLAMIIAMALSAFYLLPLWLNKPFITVANFTDGHKSVLNNFLIHPNEYTCLPYFLLAMLAAFIIVRKRAEKKNINTAAFLIVLVVGFMVLPVSATVWSILTPLQYLQFPFRFLTAALLPFACLSGYLLLHTRLAPLVVVTWGMGALFHGYILFAYTPYDTQGVITRINEYKVITPTEYRTQWQEDYTSILKNILKGAYKTLPPASILSGEGKIYDSSGKDNSITASGMLSQGGRVVFHRTYFPGMDIRDTQTGTRYRSEAAGTDGLLSASIPAGEFALETRPGWFAGQKTGDIISLCSLIFCLIVMLRGNTNAFSSTNAKIQQ